LKVAGLGLLAGVVGSLAMVAAMLAMRTWLGISPPFEALPDRFAPTLDIPTFFSLFGRFGGYNGLKRFGITSGLTGLFAVGALVGVAYAVVVESGRSRRATGWRAGFSPVGLAFVAAAAVVLWLATAAVLWPVLDANYRGLPPGQARLASLVGLLVSYALYGTVLVLAYRFVTRRPAVAGAAAGSETGTWAAAGARSPGVGLVAGQAAGSVPTPTPTPAPARRPRPRSRRPSRSGGGRSSPPRPGPPSPSPRSPSCGGSTGRRPSPTTARSTAARRSSRSPPTTASTP
jgi:hypothetical protein